MGVSVVIPGAPAEIFRSPVRGKAKYKRLISSVSKAGVVMSHFCGGDSAWRYQIE
jgi:hypothetical protein